MSATEFWYRYDVIQYAAPVDEFDNPCGTGSVELVVREYHVKHRTPKGVRLTNGKFVNLTARKRFACPTKQEARESLIARKKAHVRILTAQLACAKRMLAIAEGTGEATCELSGFMEAV